MMHEPATAPTVNDPRWESLTPEEVVAHLDVEVHEGLSIDEANRRLERHGANKLTEAARRPTWMLFADQFKGTLVLILAGAAVVAGLVGDLKDTIVIAVVLVINGVLGFIQENRAAKSLGALRSMLAPTARVRRDGSVVEIDAAVLVPGDVVLLEAGDRVPADGRIVVAAACEIDESALTGESAPVAKQTSALAGTDEGPRITVGDRTNAAHMNTVVREAGSRWSSPTPA